MESRELPSHLTELFEKSTENLNHSQELQLQKLLIDNADVFAKSSSDLGRTSVVEHTINVGEAKPIKQPARRPPKTLFMKEDEMHNRALRSTSNGSLAVPRSKTAIFDGSFSCSAPRLWNQLPEVTKKASSLSCFKTQVKQFMFNE